MRKLLLVALFMSIVGCTINTGRRQPRKPQTVQNQLPRTTVLHFNPVVKERKPAELPPPNNFPRSNFRPKKLH